MREGKALDGLKSLLNHCLSFSGLLNLNNYHNDLPPSKKKILIEFMEKWVLGCSNNDNPSSLLQPLVDNLIESVREKGIDAVVRDEFWASLDGFDGKEYDEVQAIFKPLVYLLINEYCPIDFDREKLSLVELEVPNYLTAIIKMLLNSSTLSFNEIWNVIDTCSKTMVNAVEFGIEFCKSQAYIYQGLAIGYLEVELFKMKYFYQELGISADDREKIVNVYLNSFRDIRENATFCYKFANEKQGNQAFVMHLDPADFIVRECLIDELEDCFDELLRYPGCDDEKLLNKIATKNEALFLNAK